MDWRVSIIDHEWLIDVTKVPSLQHGAFRSNLAAPAVKVAVGCGLGCWEDTGGSMGAEFCWLKT